MGNADAQSRRGNKSDFYITPFPAIIALLDEIELEHKSILDPCCGTGAIGKMINEYVLKCEGFSFTEYDIKDGYNFFDEKKYYDIIIANPPYSKKNKFINHARRVAKDIYMILPLNVCNYNEFHNEFLNNLSFMGKYLMTPKFFMDKEENYGLRRGGISAYAWFHWSGMGSMKIQDSRGSYEKYIDLNLYIRK